MHAAQSNGASADGGSEMSELLLSRRSLLKRGAGTATGTALGGLAALGADLRPAAARAQELRIKGAKAYPSVCPYCAVGCDTIVHATGEGADRKIINVEGDVRSPVNGGN